MPGAGYPGSSIAHQPYIPNSTMPVYGGDLENKHYKQHAKLEEKMLKKEDRMARKHEKQHMKQEQKRYKDAEKLEKKREKIIEKRMDNEQKHLEKIQKEQMKNQSELIRDTQKFNELESQRVNAISAPVADECCRKII